MKNNQDLFSDENFFAKEGSYTYQMIATGEVPSDEECQEAVKLARKARLSFDKKNLAFQGLSALTHAAILFTALFFVPSLSSADEEKISDDQLYFLTQKLSALAEKEEEIKETKESSNTGAETSVSTKETGNSSVVTSAFGQKHSGTENKSSIPMGREEALQAAGNFGMISLVKEMGSATLDWGKEPSGNGSGMWGQGDFSSNGINLSGIGEGSGNISGGFIGTGGINTGISGFKGREPRLLKQHQSQGPSLRVGQTVVSNGGVAPELVQRIVRQNFGRFRSCYENGLRTNPSLTGRVSVRFIISREGSVSTTQNGGSDIASSEVISCVVRAFYGLSFPSGENQVTVTYPILFSNQ